LGAGFLPELHYRPHVADGSLKLILPEWHSPEATLHLVYTSRRGLLPGVRAVLDFAADALDLSSAAWTPRSC
ncbi:MAG TPA: LysR substrate-binding domain-containing protein, partial [Rhizomicrobium sp.]|nr:LysR substrate-binding domain-containing protein [Rhizomicrobium sp.]